MSWFTDFLTDTARQAAPGIHKGINDDQQKRRDLEAMRQQIPILVEQQKALMPGELEKVNAGLSSRNENALRLLLIGKEMDRRRALEVEAAKAANKNQGAGDVLSFLKAKVETPQDPSVLPAQAGTPNYSMGEEAAAGVVPPTRTRNAQDVFMETIGLNPAEREAVPSMTSEGKWGLSFPQKPKPPSSSARSMGVTNPLIQAGMFLGYGPDIQNWTPEQHRNAEAHELEKKIAGAINLDRKLYEDSLKMFPGDKLSGLNEFIRVLTTRAAGQSYGSALGPTLTAPPVPYPNAQTAPWSGRPTQPSGPAPQPQSSAPPDLTPEERQRYDAMPPAQKKAFLAARGTASGGTASNEIQTQIKAGQNVLRQLQDLERDPNLEKYSWSGQRYWEEGRDLLSGLTKGALVSPNKEYNDFRQKLRTTALQAFDFGGKQLTETEKKFVLDTVPSGGERTPVEMRAKVTELRKRIEYLTTVQSKLVNLPRSEYEQAVKAELEKYTGGTATETVPKLQGKGLDIVRGAPKGKTFTINGKTYTKEQLLGGQ